MKIEETKQIVQKIAVLYPQFNDKIAANAAGIVKGWHEVLEDYDYDTIRQNLMQYVKRNKFAPSIAELVAEPEPDKIDLAENGRKAVPNAAETYRMLAEQAKAEQASKLTPEQIDKARAEMKKVIDKIVQDD